MASLPDIALAVRHLGPGWLARRIGYAARRRLGFIKLGSPRVSWREITAAKVDWQKAPSRPVPSGRHGSTVPAGRFHLYSARVVEAGFPPQWNRNQTTGALLPQDAHWSAIGDFSFGDIKDVWELSRFAWAFELVRDGRAEAEAAFWRLFADWMERNPPNSGPNWMCGQEAAIRLIAVVFAAERLAARPDYEDALGKFVVATGQRIEANLGYALAQKNNHGISECVGLLTAALLVPGHAAAPRWRARALRELEAQVRELFYPDGAFAQHSLIYHRLALNQLCWAAIRLIGAGAAVPQWLLEAGSRATEFLKAITDPECGDAPLYGANDGANILPLCSCDFQDMRPAVQLGSAVFQQRLIYTGGAWDESAFWLVQGADQMPRQQRPLSNWQGRDGGLVQLAHGADRLIMRCPERFRHRPGHADFGHVDVWLGGHRVAIDGGSFSYNSRERFSELGSARQHNAVTIDAREPMRRVKRFLYVPWPGGSLQPNGDAWTYEPQIFGESGVKWQRTVLKREDGGFVVRDAVTGASRRVMRWHWRLPDWAWRREAEGLRAEIDGASLMLRWKFSAETTVEIVRADERSAGGWEAPHYGQVEPAVSITWLVQGASEVGAEFEFWSV